MTSKLPPELWLTIFHHATHVPGTLVPDVYALASVTGSAYSKSANAALRDALVTKRALVRVCKRWWHLAIAILYVSVYVGRARCLSSLATTLARYAAREGTLVGARPLGEYTQRLDLVVRDHAENVDADLDSLATLITNMPRLAIVLFVNVPAHYSPDIPKNIFDALRHSATSLRVLDFRSSRLEPPVGSATSLLAECTQLRVLNCPRLLWSGDFRYLAIPPTVTTLRLQTIIPIVAHDVFRQTNPTPPPHPGPSALQELILDLNLDIYRWKDMLQVYSPQLVSVQFYIPSLSMIDVHGHLQLLTQTCPALRRLILTSECFSTFARPHLVLPSITYLGLRILRAQAPKVDFEKLFVLLAELRSSVPSLRVVQLLNEPNVQCLIKTHTKFAVCALQSFVEGASIRIEDSEGVLLTGLRLSVPWLCLG